MQGAELLFKLILSTLFFVNRGVFKHTVILKKTFDVFEKTSDVF